MASDPTLDPRSEELLGADPSEVAAAAALFGLVSHQSDAAVSRMHTLAGAPNWQGKAYSSMQSSLSEMSGKLSTIGSAFTDAEQAMSHYESVLSKVQSEYQTVAAEIATANGQVTSLTTTFDDDRATAEALAQGKKTDLDNGADKKTIKADNKALKSANGTVSSDGTALSNAVTAQQQLWAKGMYLLDRFEDARHHASTKIASGASDAPKQGFSFNPLHIAEHLITDAADLVAALGKGLYDDATALPGDIDNLIKHPSLKNVEHLVEDAAVVIGAIALPAALASGALEALGAVDAAETATTVSEASEAVTNAVAAVQTGEDIVHGRIGDIAVDFIASKIPDASDALGVGKDAVETLEGQKTALEAYKEALVTFKGNSAAAYASLKSDDQEALQVAEGVAVVPATTQDADTMINSTEEALHKAKIKAGLIGAPTSAAQENLTDKGTDAVKTTIDGGDGSSGSGNSSKQPVGAASGS